jgi:hypothetical protein
MSTATLAARRNQNLYRQPTKMRLGPTSATFVVIALISVLALLYLNQITKTNLFSYQINKLQTQKSEILAEKQDLGVEAARLQSIQATQNSAVVAQMIPVGQVSYVK